MKTRILTAVGLLAFLIWNPYPLQVLELKTFDWLMSTKPIVQDEMILLVDIDEDFTVSTVIIHKSNAVTPAQM